MAAEVIGAGYMFLASGCGPVLSKEQRQELTKVDPEAWYPQAKLLEILAAAEAKNPKIVYATGRRWGAAIKEEFSRQGVVEPMMGAKTLEEAYLQHHQGDAGTLVVEEDGAEAFFVSNKGSYPHLMIHAAFEALVFAMNTVDVMREETDDPRRCRISWTTEA